MKKPIVSSAHLVSDKSAELSEYEYGLIIASNSFDRWIVRCAAAAGLKDLGPLDVLVLHSVNHRARAKKLADLCFVLNVEDTHTVAYSCRKLVKQGLIKSHKQNKENHYAATAAGRAACARYREVREGCLVDVLQTLGVGNDEVGAAAATLRALSGLYDQAARAAASL
jgi:predicted MarR family transcription regulator